MGSVWFTFLLFLLLERISLRADGASWQNENAALCEARDVLEKLVVPKKKQHFLFKVSKSRDGIGFA